MIWFGAVIPSVRPFGGRKKGEEGGGGDERRVVKSSLSVSQREGGKEYEGLHGQRGSFAALH